MLRTQPPRLRIPLPSIVIHQHRLHVFRHPGGWLDGVLGWRSGITFPASEPHRGISCCVPDHAERAVCFFHITNSALAVTWTNPTNPTRHLQSEHLGTLLRGLTDNAYAFPRSLPASKRSCFDCNRSIADKLTNFHCSYIPESTALKLTKPDLTANFSLW